MLAEPPETTRAFWAALDFCYRKSDFGNQEALAKAAGVARSTIAEQLNKTRGSGPRVQSKIAHAFGYDLVDFLALGKRLLEGDTPAPVPSPGPHIPDWLADLLPLLERLDRRGRNALSAWLQAYTDTD